MRVRDMGRRGIRGMRKRSRRKHLNVTNWLRQRARERERKRVKNFKLSTLCSPTVSLSGASEYFVLQLQFSFTFVRTVGVSFFFLFAPFFAEQALRFE